MAAKLAGVSRRTFYNHISNKGISVTIDADGKKKIDISELQRVYDKETIMRNLKKLNDTGRDTDANEKNAQRFTQKDVQYEKLLLEERLVNAKAMIQQLESERDRLIEDKKENQEQLKKALDITLLLENRSDGAGEWEKSIKVLEGKIANQEERYLKEKEEREKLAAEIRQKEQEAEEKIKRLKRALKQEQNKTIWQKMFDRKKQQNSYK